MSVVYSISNIQIKKPRTQSTRIYHHCIDSMEDWMIWFFSLHKLSNLKCLKLFSESDYTVSFLIFDKDRFSGSLWCIVCIRLYDVLVTKDRYMKTLYPNEWTVVYKAWFWFFPLIEILQPIKAVLFISENSLSLAT